MYIEAFQKFKPHLERGTYDHQDWSYFQPMPKSRAYTFEYALINFVHNVHNTVVELGTIRSYCHGGDPRCSTDDKTAWKPGDMSFWDWGAGCFSRVMVECISDVNQRFVLNTVDIVDSHIERCKLITRDYRKYMQYHVQNSTDYLRRFHGQIDLLYMDTGDIWPLEPTATLSLEECKIVVERNLISPYGIIVMDDIKNTTPKKFGEASNLAKGKYSLEYLTNHGFEIIVDEYQVILRKR